MREEKKTQISMKISTILSGKKRVLRLGFTRYVVEKYGLNRFTAHTKIRRGMFRKWEIVGIAECVNIFLGYPYEGRLEDFYEILSVKSDFLKFMSSELGISERTARRRFKDFDFTEFEIKGLEKVYQEFYNEEIKGE